MPKQLNLVDFHLFSIFWFFRVFKLLISSFFDMAEIFLREKILPKK